MLIAREATKECLQTHFTQRSPNPLAALQNGFWWRKEQTRGAGQKGSRPLPAPITPRAFAPSQRVRLRSSRLCVNAISRTRAWSCCWVLLSDSRVLMLLGAVLTRQRISRTRPAVCAVRNTCHPRAESCRGTPSRHQSYKRQSLAGRRLRRRTRTQVTHPAPRHSRP